MRGLRGARFYWGLSERLVRPPESGVVELEKGVVVAAEHADWIARNIYRGLYERSELRVLSSVLGDGSVLIDVGANTGMYVAYSMPAS
jgi:hypothetical protein